jgi:hypothetical protein
MPDHGSRKPIHCAPVPLNVKVARMPASSAIAALPPLRANIQSLVYQVPEYWTLELFCSDRSQLGFESSSFNFATKAICPSQIGLTQEPQASG